MANFRTYRKKQKTRKCKKNRGQKPRPFRQSIFMFNAIANTSDSENISQLHETYIF